MPDLEIEKLEKLVETVPEVEDLSDVDLGLPDEAVLVVAARERLSMAQSYQILSVRLAAVSASVRANESVGNKDAAKNFQAQEATLERDMKHCLRGIKTIDRMYPAAKARMQALTA